MKDSLGLVKEQFSLTNKTLQVYEREWNKATLEVKEQRLQFIKDILQKEFSVDKEVPNEVLILIRNCLEFSE